MKKILYTLLATASGIVLLFSYRTSTEVVAATSLDGAGTDTTTTTPTATASSSAAASSSTSTDSGTSTTKKSTSSSSAASSSAASKSGLTDGTYTGAAVGTRYGNVQVKVTISGGKITAVDAIDYPNNDRRDQMINSQAIPQLTSEAIAAQSANIDMISGATYTSTGYISSLQDALDQAAQ